MPALRLLDERTRVEPTCDLREPAFFRARAFLGNVAIRNFGDFPPPSVVNERSERRRTRRLGRHSEATDNPLRSSVRDFFSLLDGLPSASHRRGHTSGMAPARALLSAAAAFCYCAQIYGGI